MRIKKFTRETLIILCGLIAVAGSCKASNPSSAHDQNQFINIVNPNDFVMLMGQPLPDLPENRNDILALLDRLTVNIENNADMALAFNILLNSPKLSDREKSQWLKARSRDLPTPFLFLRALFEEDQTASKRIYMIARGYLNMDSKICIDKSASQAGFHLLQAVGGKIFTQLGADLNNIAAGEDFMMSLQKDFFDEGGFEKFDQIYGRKLSEPHWMAQHGMMPLMGGGQTLFEPKSKWQEIKKREFATIYQAFKNQLKKR
ncbi:MAG: hypothetical protein ACK5O7_04600 [Holosporales bacterium]